MKLSLGLGINSIASGQTSAVIPTRGLGVSAFGVAGAITTTGGVASAGQPVGILLAVTKAS